MTKLKIPPDVPINESGLIESIRVEKSIRHIWVKPLRGRTNIVAFVPLKVPDNRHSPSQIIVFPLSSY